MYNKKLLAKIEAQETRIETLEKNLVMVAEALRELSEEIKPPTTFGGK